MTTNILFDIVYSIKDIVKNFKENLNINIDKQDENGNTVLHILFSIDNNMDTVMDITKILLSKNVNLFIHNKKKQIPEHILSKNPNNKLQKKIFNLLYETEQYKNTIHYYLYTRNYIKLRENIKEQKHLLNTKISLYRGFSYYPLIFLLGGGCHNKEQSENICEIIKLFVDNGVDINIKNEDKNNIVHCLIKYNLCDDINTDSYINSGYKNCIYLKNIIECLIENGVNINHKNNNDETPLKLLCSIKSVYNKYYLYISQLFDILIDNTYIDDKEYCELMSDEYL